MFLAMMQHSWGKGATKDAAISVAAKEGSHGRKRKPRIVWEFDPAKTPKAFVDQMGSLCWEGEKPVEVERVGVDPPRKAMAQP